MSRKHVEEYFNQISNDYHDMMEALRDMEDEVSNNLLSPDRLDNMKALIEPIKDNYMTWSYMMFLLNKPNKKKKQARYANQQGKNLDENFSPEAFIEQDKKIIEELKDGKF